MDHESEKYEASQVPYNQWNPPPLVLDDHVFSWTSWLVELIHAVPLQGSTEVAFRRLEDGQEMVFRDTTLAGEVGHFLRLGTEYTIVGLGEKMVQSNWYFQESVFTYRLDRRFQFRYLTQGVLGRALDHSQPYYLSSRKAEKQQLLFNYFREVYFWSFLRITYFKSEQEKIDALPNIRRDANDVATEVAKGYLGFNGKKYRNDRLPSIDGTLRNTGW